MTVSSIHGKSRVKEINAVLHQVLVQLAPVSDQAPFLNKRYVEYEEMNQSLTTAINAANIEAEQETNDGFRDDAIRGLVFCVRSYSYMPDEETRELIKPLTSIIDRNGLDIINLNYDEQTSATNSLLAELDNPELEPIFLTLPILATHRENIRTTNGNFVKVRTEYLKAINVKKANASASTLARNIRLGFNKKLVNYLNALEEDEPEVFGDVVKAVAGIIDENNRKVKMRESSTEEQTEEESSN